MFFIIIIMTWDVRMQSENSPLKVMFFFGLLASWYLFILVVNETDRSRQVGDVDVFFIDRFKQQTNSVADEVSKPSEGEKERERETTEPHKQQTHKHDQQASTGCC